MVAVFKEVWRVLKDDGTLWLNLGDSYAGSGAGGGGNKKGNEHQQHDALVQIGRPKAVSYTLARGFCFTGRRLVFTSGHNLGKTKCNARISQR